jgi:glycosyltransferase involved in cell wall biosynthesis
VVAVNRKVDSVFDFLSGPISFARDHSCISEFSRSAVSCGCRTRRCGHLVQAIQETFGVSVTLPNWRHWNGGLFVFDSDSIPFLNRWHDFTRRIFDNPYWKVRDQGTLAATVWDQSLQDSPVLPHTFNTIVDCFRGIPEALRSTARATSFVVDDSYRLNGTTTTIPSFLHFINGGMMRRGWKNWDQAESILKSSDLSTRDSGLEVVGSAHVAKCSDGNGSDDRETEVRSTLEINGDSAAFRCDRLGPTVSERVVARVKLEACSRQPISPHFQSSNHINILVPSLALGGAERSVVETLQGLNGTPSATARLFLLHEACPSYEIAETPSTRVYRLYKPDMKTRLKMIALEVIASPSRVVFTHMIKAEYLRVLWDYGVLTIPVIQNSLPSWQDPPESFRHANVPFLVAVSDSVARQLRTHGCPRPVITVRHELQRWFSVDELEVHRKAIRDQYSIADDTLLIGMVGEFKSQKAYTRAVRVLARIRQEHPAKLMILGGWDHEWGHGRAAYTATCRQAVELDVIADVLTPGRVRDVERYFAAFDVFLNTSVYEGLSVATLEAVQSGCPVVSADAGGNSEGLPPDAVVITDSANSDAYVLGIETAIDRDTRSVPQRPYDSGLIPRLWMLLGQYGLPEGYRASKDKSEVLFLTDNLNVGGAPRSLVNLVCELNHTVRPWLGVMMDGNHQSHFDDLMAAGVRVFSTLGAKTYLDRAERCLEMITRLGAGIVVFWNLDARIKLLLAKILPPGCVQLIDVSPGPLLFDELDDQSGFQCRIAFTREQYFQRIDRFVSKYSGGKPADFALNGDKLIVIPNGVPEFKNPPSEEVMPILPPGADPELVIGTCCRIVPDKRLEFLAAMMVEISFFLPGARLVIVGGAHQRNATYFDHLQSYIQSQGLSNIIFAGHQSNVIPYLRQFRVFVMISDRQGCPNASLEAMAMGLPVVANCNGGTAEQVEHGVNGFLVSDEDPSEMARHVCALLKDQDKCLEFGNAGRRIAKDRFSMARMAQQYNELFQSVRTPSEM